MTTAIGSSALSFLAALAIGLLIGAERERRKDEVDSHRPAGLRTFAITALLGATAAMLGPTVVVLGGAFIASGALIGYARAAAERDLTAEVALMAVFLLGAMTHDRAVAALAVGVVIAALLGYRKQLHRLVREVLTEQELLDGLAFAVAAACVLPILPDRALDPWGLVNPFTLWRLAVVVMGLSGLGYIAQRLVGERHGLIVAGLASGLVSATAAVAAMAGRSRAEGEARATAAGAVASLLSSVVYMAALIGTVSPALLGRLWPSLAAAAIVSLAFAWRLAARSEPGEARPKANGHAFDIPRAALFVALVAGFTALARGLQYWMGQAGALAGAAVTGLADAHAAAASMAALANAHDLSTTNAAVGVLAGLTTNMLVKAPIAFSLGARAYARWVSAGIVLLLGAAWAAWAVASLGWRP